MANSQFVIAAVVDLMKTTFVFKFQTMVILLLKSTKLLADDFFKSSNLNTIKEQLEDIEMDIYVHMVQIDMLNTDIEKRISEEAGKNTLVRQS